jgi:hypothetical protein
MSNLLVAEDAPTHEYRVAAPTATVPALVKPEETIEGWLIDILVLVVGLLALFYFVALGEMFALVGPWLIFTGVLSIRKRPGSGRQLLRIVTGAGLLCLSAAVFLLPHHAGSWCAVGGILGLLAGLGYLAATLFTTRKARKPIP